MVLAYPCLPVSTPLETITRSTRNKDNIDDSLQLALGEDSDIVVIARCTR